jgi:hypothetical protein
MKAICTRANIGLKPFGEPVYLTKDVIKARGLNPQWEGERYWDVPMQFIEPWSLTKSPANQYVTAAVVLSKDICEPCVEKRAEWYIKKGLYGPDQMEEALAHSKIYFETHREEPETIKAIVTAPQKSLKDEMREIAEELISKYFPS